MDTVYQDFINKYICKYIKMYIDKIQITKEKKNELYSFLCYDSTFDKLKIYERENFILKEEIFHPLFYLEKTIPLNDVQIFALRLSFLASQGQNFRYLFSILQENSERIFPSIEFAFQIYSLSKDESIEKGDFINELFEGFWNVLFYEVKHTPILSGEIILRECVEQFLLGVDVLENNQLIRWSFSENENKFMANLEAFLSIKKIMKYNDHGYIYLSGLEFDERECFCIHVAEKIKKPLIIASDKDEEEIKDSIFFAILTGAILMIKNSENLNQRCNVKVENLLKSFEESLGFVFLDFDFGNLNGWHIILKELTREERYKLWTENLGKNVDINIFNLANKFLLTQNKIEKYAKNAIIKAKTENCGIVTEKIINDCCYVGEEKDFFGKAVEIKTNFTWEQLILPDDSKIILKQACNRMKYRHIVFDKWGFEKLIPYGKGISILFEGPPGTGKTMAAQVAAAEIGLKLYKVDLSRIISKYIGETEKNLKEIFDIGRKNNVILFFDEMDALFGKRLEVKGANDRYINLEAAFLLQQIEGYEGVTIMATNNLSNIDEAYFRRISYILHFSLPSVDERLKIWKSVFPDDMPISNDVDFNYLSKQFELSGAIIKNTAVNAAFLAVMESSDCKIKHILKALKQEMGKRGQVLIKSDFGEYGYTIKDEYK